MRLRLYSARSWRSASISEWAARDSIELPADIYFACRGEALTDEDETVQTECIKCLRVLMNTDVSAPPSLRENCQADTRTTLLARLRSGPCSFSARHLHLLLTLHHV